MYIYGSYLAELFLKSEVLQAKAVEKIKTQFVFSNFFPPRKSWSLWDNVEKCK